MPNIVQEITMAAPDIIRLMLRDGEITRGTIVELQTPDPGTPNTWIARTNPANGQSEDAFVGGIDNKWLHFEDQQPDAFVDRAAIKNTSNWPTIGGRTVSSVHLKVQPYDQGLGRFSGSNVNMSSMEHEVFLKLDGILPFGSHTISITGDTFPATAFTYNDKQTRSDSIRCTQVGHRPNALWKKANLAVWIPEYGTEGRVDFATDYSLTSFHIIDESGAIQHTGSIILHSTPTQVETGVTLSTYPSTTTPPKIATAVTTGNPTRIQHAGHGFSNGEVKYFRGFGGVNGIERGFGTVTVVDTDNFDVDISTSGTYVAGTYLSGHDSRIYDTFEANRANTYVYEMDFTSFEPTSFGKYRVYVPGLGVSWPFTIDPAINLHAAKHSVKGYMTQCWGLGLSHGTAGWNRPPQYRGPNFSFFETDMPAHLDGESGYGTSGFILTDQAGEAPWVTANAVSGWFGAWSDAGDWDFHFYRHAGSIFQMLDVGYDQLPSAVRNLDLGFPQSSLNFGSVYSSIDAAASIFHVAIWYLEPFRKTQKISGEVYGGCSYGGGELITSGGGSQVIPSWRSTATMYLHRGDPVANFMYAHCAAKLGRLLKEEGYTTVGQLWIDSAEDAYDWAEAIYTDYDASGITGAAWVAHYLTDIDVKTNSGWSDAQLTTVFDNLHLIAGNSRVDAAGALYAATEGTAYEAVMVGIGFVEINGTHDVGVWEYIRKGTGAGDVIDYVNGIIGNPSRPGRVHIHGSGLYNENLADEFAFNTGLNGPTSYQPSGIAIYAVWPYIAQTPNTATDWDRWLVLIEAGEAYNTGANQQGLCCTTGIGYNNTVTLIRDREAANIKSEDMPGITTYTWPGSAGAVFFNNYSSDAPSIYTVELPTGNFEDTNGTKKIIEPIYDCRPKFEVHIRNTYDVFSTEYVTQNQILGRISNNLFLHAYDGNAVTELTNAPVSASLSL